MAIPTAQGFGPIDPPINDIDQRLKLDTDFIAVKRAFKTPFDPVSFNRDHGQFKIVELEAAFARALRMHQSSISSRNNIFVRYQLSTGDSNTNTGRNLDDFTG